MVVMPEPIWRHAKPSAEPPLQFTIRDLLIAQAVCAVCLGLIASVGVFGLIAAFLATLAYKAAPVSVPRTKLKRCVIDVLGGILLPAAFLIWLHGHLNSEPVLWAVVEVTFQSLALLVWLSAGSRPGVATTLLAGIFVGGVVATGLLATACLLPGLYVLTFYGVGLAFFIPILTCCVYLGSAIDAARVARVAGRGRIMRLPYSFGITIALMIPILTDAIAGPSIEAILQSLHWPHGWLGDIWPTPYF
jgi:hypothetical protein